MALNGSYTKGIMVMTWTATQNRAENYSTVNIQLVLAPDDLTQLTYNGYTTVHLQANGGTTAVGQCTDLNQVLRYTAQIPHDIYGEATLHIYAMYMGFGGIPNSDSFEVDFKLDSIPKGASIISAPKAFTDEDTPTITYKSDYASTRAIISTNSNDEEPDIIIQRDLEFAPVSGEFTFEFTDEEKELLQQKSANVKSRTLYFGVYSATTGVWWYDWLGATFTVANANPTARGTVKDINPTTIALTGDENTLIRFVSTAEVKAQYTAYKYATLAGYWIEHNNNIFPEIEHIFEKVEGNIFAFHATDSRGNEGESYVQAPMIEYLRLTCNIDSSEKPDTEGNMNVKCSGNYFNNTFGFTETAIANTLQVQYRYKPQNGTYTAWLELPYTINDDGTYEASTVATGFDYTGTYVFQCRAIDRLSDVTSIELVVKSLPVFHWGEEDFVFEVPVTFNAGTIGIEHPDFDAIPNYSQGGLMDGDLEITGDLRLKGAETDYGNTLYFGDEENAYIREESDNELTVKAETIVLDGAIKLSNGQAIEYGEWTPVLTSLMKTVDYDVPIASYTTQQGWYQRTGNIVSLGFFVKAICNPGFEIMTIYIEGAPYIPAYTASGGGMCSGAYKDASYTFQCWAIETAIGRIAARVATYGTTGNITTSASGLRYRLGGGEITVSGTITYMIAE